MNIEKKLAELYPKMTPAYKKIADYLMSRGDIFLLDTAKELADKTGSSEASIIRFANFVGFSGYKELKETLQADLEKQLSVSKRFFSSGELKTTTYSHLFQNAIDNLQRTYDFITEPLLMSAVEMILNARRVGVACYRLGIAPASIMVVLLQQILDDVRMLTPDIGISYDTIKSWNEKDVVIGFSMSHKKSYTCSMLEYAKERGCKIICITDNHTADISTLGDIVLVTSTEGSLTSMVPSVTLTEVLVNLIYQERKEHLEKSLSEVDHILEKYHY